MPSSTSSSEAATATTHRIHDPNETSLADFHSRYHTPEREWNRSFLLMLCLTLLGVAGWEMYWRGQGYGPSAVNSDELWCKIRDRVGERGTEELAIIGSSRVLFDLDIEVLGEELGTPRPLQLALEGTCPRPFLSDIANDAKFKGLLLVGVTPPLFFGGTGGARGDLLEYREKRRTLATRFGQLVALPLERSLGFLEPDLKLFELLKRMDWPQRAGMPPPFHGVRKLMEMNENRDTWMWWKVEKDPAYQKIARDTWTTIMGFPGKPVTPEQLEEVLTSVSADVAKIQARGGKVIFIRCPSTGPWREGERKGFPRESYWDALLKRTGAEGIHFEDFAELQGFELPEWSHIAASQRTAFTQALVPLIKEKMAR